MEFIYEGFNGEFPVETRLDMLKKVELFLKNWAPGKDKSQIESNTNTQILETISNFRHLMVHVYSKKFRDEKLRVPAFGTNVVEQSFSVRSNWSETDALRGCDSPRILSLSNPCIECDS